MFALAVSVVTSHLHNELIYVAPLALTFIIYFHCLCLQVL